jgi:YVTN family beta-propeller protein
MSKKLISQIFTFAVLFIFISGCTGGSMKNVFIRSVGPQPDSSILVPSNQLLRPAGFQVYLPGRPADLALSKDGNFLFVKNKDDIDLIRLYDRKIIQSLPYEQSGASFTGICLSPDGQHVYVTDADRRICIAGMDKNRIMKWEKPLILPSPPVGDSPVPGGLAVSEKGDRLYVTLSRNNTLGVVNLADRSIRQIEVGMAPYKVILKSPRKAYVSNWGGRRIGLQLFRQ